MDVFNSVTIMIFVFERNTNANKEKIKQTPVDTLTQWH